MKVMMLALTVLANGPMTIEDHLRRCEELKLTVCTFTIEEEPAPKPVSLKQCELLDGERVCSA